MHDGNPARRWTHPFCHPRCRVDWSGTTKSSQRLGSGIYSGLTMARACPALAEPSPPYRLTFAASAASAAQRALWNCCSTTVSTASRRRLSH